MISFSDIRRLILAFFLILLTTIFSVYFRSVFQSYSLSVSDLSELKTKNIPDIVIKPLHELQRQKFFFKYQLMNEARSIIQNQDLFQRYAQEIKTQISIVPQPAIEYFFLGFLAFFFWVFGFICKIFLPDDLK